MLVSCICICHNKPSLTHEAIDSVVNQNYPDWELIVFDSGVLYDQNYYDKWKNDSRIKVVRSDETEETRKTKAMAPWCYNECFRKGLVHGDLIMYLCDDDFYYANAFETFVTYSKYNPEVLAMYASQDVGVIYPNGWRAIVAERIADQVGGVRWGGKRLDCVVDGEQLCHKREILDMFGDPWWAEEKGMTEYHADGVFLERIASVTPIKPIDIKVGQNRRTPQSLYVPMKG